MDPVTKVPLEGLADCALDADNVLERSSPMCLVEKEEGDIDLGGVTVVTGTDAIPIPTYLLARVLLG